MCKELEDELKRGDEAAKALVEHMENMGMADKMSRPVQTENGCYVIEVRKTL